MSYTTVTLLDETDVDRAARGQAMVDPVSPSRWLTSSRCKQDGRLRLFCLPYAGTGASMFREWQRNVPADVEIWPIQLPGRESRIHEPPFTRAFSLVPVLADAIQQYLDKPFLFFGHSMGALIVFELARELRHRRAQLPHALFLSGRSAPHLDRGRPDRYLLSDEEFLQELQALNEGRQNLPDYMELMRIMVPTIRADFEICDTYRHFIEPRLSSPLVVWGGYHDPETRAADLEAWQEHTSASFRLHMMPGDHFFLQDPTVPFMKKMVQELECILPDC